MNRKNKRWSALDPKLNLKNRQELIEADYINKLSDAEKDWLNKFNEEYVNASFIRTKTGKYSRNNLQKGNDAKEATTRNNLRNNDVFAIKKASNMLSNETFRMDKYQHTTASLI